MIFMEEQTLILACKIYESSTTLMHVVMDF